MIIKKLTRLLDLIDLEADSILADGIIPRLCRKGQAGSYFYMAHYNLR
jgi:hypothetical protein